MDRTQEALDRMATEDPALAARLFVQMLPALARAGPIASPGDARAAGAPV